MKAIVFEIKRLAVHDGDGVRTTVFFKGCPLRCLWCHNPEGLLPMPQTAFYEHKCISCGACQQDGFQEDNCFGQARVRYGREMTVEELLPLLTEDRDFYEIGGGGVTLSGGECLIQEDFCAALLKRLKEEGIRTAVDTCGYVNPSAFDKVLPYTDCFLYDLKAMDEEVHLRCTGKSNRLILENLKYLNERGAKVEVRIPYVPEYNADEIPKIASFLRNLGAVKKVKILPYHKMAGEKYRALGMNPSMPARVPTEREIQEAEQYFDFLPRK